LKTFIRLVI